MDIGMGNNYFKSSKINRTLIRIFVKELEIRHKHKLLKLKKKNIGNVKLVAAIDDLIVCIEQATWKNHFEILQERPDADCVVENFYFFDIHIHRIFLGVYFREDEASIAWCGSHADYASTFKNNRDTIRKWLKSNNWIN